MGRVGGASLIPARFLLMLAHFVVAVCAFFEKDALVQACDRVDTTQDDTRKDELLAALILTMICFGVEFASFFSGVSMFNNPISILSIVCHAAGALAFSFLIIDTMCSNESIWYIWAFCSLLPVLYEAALLYVVFVKKIDT
eukprot:m.24463 g.24463  ORF g.24463 m.24463 type:complete len:141 (-) comp11247_c0_seq1:212-634(-)